MAERSYRGLLWALALLGVVADQWAKYGVFHWLQPLAMEQAAMGRPAKGEYHVLPGAFELLAQFHRGDGDSSDSLVALTPRVNKGALFGLGDEYGYLANGLFAVVSVVAAVAIIVWSFRKSTAREWLLCVALGLILAGTLGNLYDRVVFAGVRDFLYFYWIEWPVFNVADCCLVCGAFLLLAQACWSHRHSPSTQPAAVETAMSQPVAQVN
jgi:lipoprotein signal peptidase